MLDRGRSYTNRVSAVCDGGDCAPRPVDQDLHIVPGTQLTHP
jgi:hypothetical protein